MFFFYKIIFANFHMEQWQPLAIRLHFEPLPQPRPYNSRHNSQRVQRLIALEQVAALVPMVVVGEVVCD